MTSQAPTTLTALRRLFIEQIRATVPRIVFEGAGAWQYYERSTDAATHSRRFTIRWVPGRQVDGGYFTPSAAETEAILVVRVDYMASHVNNAELLQDDWSQIRDRLQLLTADPTTGLTLVLQTPTPPALVADNDHGRQRVSDHGLASSDGIQVDMSYTIRYLKARATAA